MSDKIKLFKANDPNNTGRLLYYFDLPPSSSYPRSVLSVSFGTHPDITAQFEKVSFLGRNRGSFCPDDYLREDFQSQFLEKKASARFSVCMWEECDIMVELLTASAMAVLDKNVNLNPSLSLMVSMLSEYYPGSQILGQAAKSLQQHLSLICSDLLTEG